MLPKLLLLVISYTLVACSLDPLPTPPPSPDYAVSDPITLPPNANDTSSELSQCAKKDRVSFRLEDGTQVEWEVPRPCDPLWYLKDEGDPPP